MDDSVLIEDDIEWAVKRLRNHRSGGPSGMQAEHLKRWLAESRKAEKEDMAAGEETTEVKESMESTESTESTEFTESTESTEASNWERLVDLVQALFREGVLAEEATW